MRVNIPVAPLVSAALKFAALTLAASLFLVSQAHGQQPLACQNTISTELSDALAATPEQLQDTDTIELSAGEFEATFATCVTRIRARRFSVTPPNFPTIRDASSSRAPNSRSEATTRAAPQKDC